MKANAEAPRRAAFLDRDGVINLDREYVYRREDFVFVPGALEGARELHRRGFMLIVITNQSGIGRGLYTEAQFHELTDWMRGEFAAAGAPLEGVYYCPHHPTSANSLYRRHLRVSQAGTRHAARRRARASHRARPVGAVRRPRD